MVAPVVLWDANAVALHMARPMMLQGMASNCCGYRRGAGERHHHQQCTGGS
jgi:hypothetical protein